MKRFLMLIAFLTSAVPCMADINITEGSGKVVASESISSKEYQKIKLIDGAASGTAGAPVDAVSGLSVRLTTTAAVINNYTTNPTTVTQSGTWTVQPGNTPNTTAWIVATSSFGVNGSSIAAAQLGTWTVQPGNTANTTAWKVDGSAVTQPVSGTVTSNIGTGNLAGITAAVNISTSNVKVSDGTDTALVTAGGLLQVDGSGVTQPVSGTVTSNIGTGNLAGITAAVNISTSNVKISDGSETALVTAGGLLQVDGSGVTQPVSIAAAINNYTTNITTVTSRVLVSSATTFPASVADAGQVQIMGDGKGRLVNQPLAPWGMVKVATATLTTDTAMRVFISSGGTGIVNNLIGCIGENASSTAADITFRSAGGVSETGSFFKLGMSASNVPVGFFPPMGIPQLTYNANWTVQGSASVTSLHVTCWYYPLAP